MKSRSILASVALVAGIAGATLSVTHVIAASSMDDIIKERQAKMKELGGHLKAIKGAIAANPDLVVERANAVKAIGEAMPDLFPAGSYVGDPGVSVKTEALPKIDSDRAAFNKIASDMAVNAAKLADIAAAGDPAATGAAFGAMAKEGCGACHNGGYRVKK